MKQPVGLTFWVALGLLGGAALAQLIAVLLYFGPQAAERNAAAAPAAAGPEPAAATPTPTPQPPAPDPAAEQKERIAALLAEAGQAEQQGNVDAAQVALEEALSLDPGNPDLLSRLATTEEQLGRPELAADYWQRLAELGPRAGRVADVAEIRARLVRFKAADRKGSARDEEGLQAGSSLGIVDAVLKEVTKGGRTFKSLRIAVRARKGESIRSEEVKINVSFYENREGDIAVTRSKVQSAWLTPPPDWQGEGLEILEVAYEVPVPKDDGSPTPRYHGYMVQLYYRGVLQDVRSDPADLVDLYPPALEIETPSNP